MKRRTALLVATILFAPAFGTSQQVSLKPVKKIGIGWSPEKWGWMSFVAFNQDGTMVASDRAEITSSRRPDSNNTSVQLDLWSFPDGRLIRTLPAQPVALSSDWKYYASPRDVVEMSTKKHVVSADEDVYPTFAFSPGSRYVAESIPGRSLVNPHIRIIELANGKRVSTFGKRQPFSIAMSPDGSTLASGYWNVVTLWNMFTGERLAVLEGFDRYILSLAFSPDGKLLAAGNDLGELQLWDIPNHKRIWSLKFDGLNVSQPAFGPDGKLMAIGIYGTGTVWLIDVLKGKVLDHRQVSGLGCGSVAFSPDGRYLITPSTGGLVKWPYDTGGTIRVFEVSSH